MNNQKYGEKRLKETIIEYKRLKCDVRLSFVSRFEQTNCETGKFGYGLHIRWY